MQRKLLITTDQIDGLGRLRERFGKEMVAYVIQHWLIDHQIIPGREYRMVDTWGKLPSGIVVQVRIFAQDR